MGAPDLVSVMEGFLCNYLPDLASKTNHSTRDWREITCPECLHAASLRALKKLIVYAAEAPAAWTPTIFFVDDPQLEQVRHRNKLVRELLDRQHKIVETILPRAIAQLPHPPGWADEIEKELNIWGDHLSMHKAFGKKPGKQCSPSGNCVACRHLPLLADITGKVDW
jgi:hypothetical protein